MARTYNFNSGIEVSIDEYLDWAAINIDENDVESLDASASMLYRLSLNKSLFNDILLSPIKKSIGSIQPENQYTDATFILGSAKKGALVVRGNLWKSPKARNGSDTYESILYSYDIPHDHNFDFLTVGYSGPGYTTDIYNYERNDVDLVVGEHVDIEFMETTNLPTGKVMLYEKSKDIHTQRPPVSPSISLNLICSTEDQYTRQQCFFDVVNNRMSGYAPGPTNSRVQIIKMIAHLEIADSVELLIDVVRKHSCSRTRAASIETILSIVPDRLSDLYTICGHENDPLIKSALTANVVT